MSEVSDEGVSSLSTPARQGREGAAAFAHRIRAWMATWRCITCNRSTPFHFYCSTKCKEAAEEIAQGKRGKSGRSRS